MNKTKNIEPFSQQDIDQAIAELNGDFVLPFGRKISDKTAELAIYALQVIEDKQAFQTIGTVDEFRELKEKNTPKEPLFIKRSITQFYACPHCSTNTHYEKLFSKMRHCEACGGVLEWK